MNIQLFGPDCPPLYGKNTKYYNKELKKTTDKINKLNIKLFKLKDYKNQIEKVLSSIVKNENK